MGDQRLRGRFSVPLAHGGKEQEFEQFIVGERFGAAGKQPLAQAGAMAAAGMGRLSVRLLRQSAYSARR